MPNNKLEIILTLDDRLSEGLKTASSKVDKFSVDLRAMGRTITQVGRTLTILGGALTGMFAVALKNASEQSRNVRTELGRLKAVLDAFYLKIAEAVLPAITKFVNVLMNLFNWFNNLSEPMMSIVLQSTFWVGVLMTMNGVLTVIVGQIMTLVGNLLKLSSAFLVFAAANVPLLITLGLIAGIVFLMFKFQDVAEIVASTFQILFLFLKNGFLTIKATLELILAGIIDQARMVVDTIAKIPGPLQEQMQAAADLIDNTSTLLRRMAFNDLQAVIDNAEEIGAVFTEGTGEWANNFDDMKFKIEELINKIKELSGVAAVSMVPAEKNFKSFMETNREVFSQLGASLQGAAAQNKKFARASQVVSIGMATMNTAESISKIWAQWGWPLGAVFSAIAAAVLAIQIATISSQKFAHGTDTVPAMLSPGEMVIPRTFAEAVRRGDLSLSGRGSQGKAINIDSINFYGGQYDAQSIATEIGYEIERELRYARGI